MLSRARAQLSKLATTIDALAARSRAVAPDLLAWPLAHAAALGSAAFVFRHPGALAALDRNTASPRDARAILAWIAAALVAIAGLHVAAVAAARASSRRRGVAPPPVGEILAAGNRRLRPLLALPLVQALAAPAIERDRPGETLFLIALAAAVAGTAVYTWPRPPASPVRVESAAPPSSRAVRGAAAIAVAGLWAGYAIFFSRLSITNHHALNTRTVSLGIYDNIFYHSIHGQPLGCSLIKAGYHGSAHFDPILVLLAPLYLVYPHAELLLVMQSVWLGAGVVPVYLIARARLVGRGAALALAAMYAMYPAVHGANLYELHSLTLLAPVALWLLYLLETGRIRGYFVLLAAALLVREDVPILMGFVGLHAVSTRRPGLTRAGWITIALSLAYFVIVKRAFMTSPDVFMSGSDAYSFAFNYEGLIPNHDGATGMLVSLVTNPVFAVRTMFTAEKVRHLVTLFLPLAFLPFLARPGRVMLVWGLLFSLLATRPALHSVHFHYPCLVFPIAFALTPIALRRIEDAPSLRAAGIDGARLARALLVAAFAASVLCSWKLGGLVENASFRAGYLPVARALTGEERARYDWLRAQIAAIPGEARVGITNRTGPHASNRRDAYFYPERADVDWLVLDEAELRSAELEKHRRNVDARAFELVARRDELAVYRARPGDAARPAEAP